MEGVECSDCCSLVPVETRHATNVSKPSSRWRMMEPTRWNAPVNPYHILELRRDATPSEIVQSYKKHALLNHPGRSASPDERRQRLLVFEILSACYETLMHNESRRRYDLRLKEMEKKRLSIASLGIYHPSDSSSTAVREQYLSPAVGKRIESCASSSSSRLSRDCKRPDSLSEGDGNATVPGMESSSSSSGSSFAAEEKTKEAKPTTFSIVCAPQIGATLSTRDFKGPKSLMESSTSKSTTAEDEGEIHFTEATVNRLFGGPLAPLHRARNFEPFTDPYQVFEQVFGSPAFPRVAIEDGSMGDRNLKHNKKKSTALVPKSPSSRNSGWQGSAYKDPDGRTTVFVSSRVVRDRKITRKETVHVDPETGKATSEVTVDGEDLEPSPENKKRETIDWLSCYGMGGTSSKENGPPSPGKKSSLSCEDFNCVYGEVLEEIYLWNKDLYSTCTDLVCCRGSNEEKETNILSIS